MKGKELLQTKKSKIKANIKNVLPSTLWVLLMVFLVLFSSPGYGGKTLKIGLLKFSRSVFEQEKQQMGKPYETMEKLIRDRFPITKYLTHTEISYDEIEAPKNFIDNTMTDETLTKLEKYCSDYGLDGIIFGHFQQTGRMTIVFRFYYSQQLAKKRGVKDRIKSFYAKIHPPDLSPKKVQLVTNDLMDRLDFIINDKKKVVLKKIPPPQPKPLAPPVSPPVTPSGAEPRPTQMEHCLYVCQLPFIKRENSTGNVNKYVEPVSQALVANVEKKILEVDKIPRLNQQNHRIPQVFVNQLWDIIEKKDTEDEILKRINNELLNPYNVDVIITGMYENNAGSKDKVIIWPKVIFKSHKKMMKGVLTLTANNVISTEKDRCILKKDVLDNIENMFNQAFGDWKQKSAAAQDAHTSSASTLPPVYAAQLGFIDASPKPVKDFRKKELELISHLMTTEINRQITGIQEKNWNKQLIINQAGNKVPNTIENIEKIIDITFDQFMPTENRIDKMVEKIMGPYHIDMIFTGQYCFNPGKSEYIFRPIVILKSKILTGNFSFDRKELVFISGSTGRVRLKRGAKKIIEDSVRALIEDLK